MPRIWLVTYDIADDRKRKKIETILSGFGRRAQYSVFECELTLDQLERIRAVILKVGIDESDSVRYYPICAHCQKKTLVGGSETERPPAPLDPYLIF